MKRLTVLLAALGLFLGGGRASACLNDRESARAEKEFKSSYVERPSTPPIAPTESPSVGQPWLYPVLTALGGVLLAGAVVVSVWPRRPRPAS
jgi:hypothetical protein